MIKVIIIDDELPSIEWLSNLLNNNFSTKIELQGTARTVNEGINLISLLHPDLIFLDIKIGEESGFDLLQKVNNKNFEVIFTTAHDKYAIQAIKFSALDYLLKPIDKEELEVTLNKLSESSKRMSMAKLDTLLHNFEKKENRLKKIIVPTSAGFEFLNISDIIRCESHINYTTIFLKENKKILVAKTLKDFEDMLSEFHFFRLHNSHLVNLSFIKSYQKGKGGFVTLIDGTKIEVSVRRKEEFLRSLSG